MWMKSVQNIYGSRTMLDGSIVRSQKWGVQIRLQIDEHLWVCWIFKKNDVRVSSMSDLVNLVKASLSSMIVRSKPEIG